MYVCTVYAVCGSRVISDAFRRGENDPKLIGFRIN